MTQYDKIKKMINRIKDVAPVGRFDYIDNIKIDAYTHTKKRNSRNEVI
jgi:hypothetical protein